MFVLELLRTAAIAIRSGVQLLENLYCGRVTIGLRPTEDGWNSLPYELKIKALSSLPLDDLKRVSECPELCSIARGSLKGRVHRTLRKFSINPRSVLKMMRKTRTVLSGSAALKIVDAGEWDENDLDFYSPKDEAGRVISWFLRHGYCVEETCRAYPPYTPEDIPQALEFAAETAGRLYECSTDSVLQLRSNNCIEAVFTLRHAGAGTKINVIQSRSSSALAPVAFFHSTIVMNAVTADAVLCAYPSLTLRGKGLMNVQTMPPLQAVRREVAGVVKYQGRGYTFTQGRDEDPTIDPVDHNQSRSWVDRHTLVMRFSEGVANSSAYEGTESTEGIQWTISYRDYAPSFGFIEYPASCVVEEGAPHARVEYMNSPPKVYMRHMH